MTGILPVSLSRMVSMMSWALARYFSLTSSFAKCRCAPFDPVGDETLPEFLLCDVIHQASPSVHAAASLTA